MIRATLFGTYNSSHPANRLLADTLAAAGVTVVSCHEPLWERTRDKMAGFFAPVSLALLAARYAGAARRLAARWRRLPPPDLVVTGFNGQLDVLLARLLVRGTIPIVFAPLVTVTETLVDDRAVYRRGGVMARLAAALDRRTLAAADLVLLDTEAHRGWLARTLMPSVRTATLYIGAEPIFAPITRRPRARGEPLQVLFYGQYVPLHGAAVIVDAAAALGPGSGIEVTMIGTGPEREAVEERARAHRCTHVRFEDWARYEELPRRLAHADVVLGSFGTTTKARMVIPTKVYQGAAAGRAVVTGDTPALREIFTPGADVHAVPPGDATALAAALRQLRDVPELAPRLGAAAARLTTTRLAPAAQAERLRLTLSAAFPALAARLAGGPVAAGGRG